MPIKLNEKGIAPIILIIIFTVVIAGVAGAVYKSKKEITIRSDKTSQVSEIKGAPLPTPGTQDINADNSGRLSDKLFTQSFDETPESTNSAVPKFSIYPPAGWSKLPPDGNIVVEFLSPSEDKIEEGMAYLTMQPNITVFIAKEKFEDLDDAVSIVDSKTKPEEKINQKSKTKINGEEVYMVESELDIRDLSKSVLENQINQELAKAAKAGKNVSRVDVQKDIEQVLKQAKGKMLQYTFYKDGYYIKVTGKSFETFWDKRKDQLKRSMDTFKFE